MDNSVIETYTQSGFPLSIGTGLALETLFDPVQKVYDDTREVPEKVSLEFYDVFYINSSTILRNIMSAVSTADMMRFSSQVYYNTLVKEIHFIASLFDMLDTELVVYTNRYKKARKEVEENKLRVPNTPKQHFIEDIFSFAMKQFHLTSDAAWFDSEIRPTKATQRKALIFTHVPYDLLSHTLYSRFDLLESHTGVLKDRIRWSSKYYPINGIDEMPFNKPLLHIFGDNVMFRPDPIARRKEVIEFLRGKNITPVTSERATISLLKLQEKKFGQ